MFEGFEVQSHRGPYIVRSEDGEPFSGLGSLDPSCHHLIVDETVARLYERQLFGSKARLPRLPIVATEDAKTLDRFSGYIEQLLGGGVRRGHALVAIGGGIVQDITCFLAAVLMRGLNWHFYPTTLLAQADSCIGSKSSINVGRVKNVIGTFTPPVEITINTAVLATLEPADVKSGVGEMLKVHAIESPEAFDQIASDYDALFTDADVMRTYIHRSLMIKKVIIERDEFDSHVRNVMNYGHSFGHAIESATDFTVPHGIGVTMGMDMANYVASETRLAPVAHYRRMHPTLARNYAGFERTPVPLNSFFDAIGKDKKNTGGGLNLVLPDSDGRVGLQTLPNDEQFRRACADYLEQERTR